MLVLAKLSNIWKYICNMSMSEVKTFIFFIGFDSKSRYSNCFYSSILVPATLQFRIRSFAMFIFNNEISITFIQALMDCCALQWLSKIYFIFQQIRTSDCLVCRSLDQRGLCSWPCSTSRNITNPGAPSRRDQQASNCPVRKNIALELIFHKLRDKILTSEGSNWHLSCSLSW